MPRKTPAVPRPPSRVETSTETRESRAGPSPDHVYNVSNARDAQHCLARRPVPRGPLGAAGAVSTKPVRAASSGPSAGRAPTSRQGSVEVTKTPVFAYLKVYGLNQYARAFAAAGLSELDAISKLSETEALDFLEQLRIYPGHKLRLLRAVECLRHAVGADRRDAAQMLEDDAALQRLNSQREELCREKAEAENESKRCQEENRRLLELVHKQAAQLQKERDRVMDLEDLVRTQTEQVQFLASQLHAMAEAGGPERVSQLFDSFRNGTGRCSVDSEDWQSAPHLSREGSFQDGPRGQAGNRIRCNSDSLLDSPFSSSQEVFSHAPSGYCPPSIRSFALSTPGQSARSKLAKSMEIPSNLEVDNLIRCLATALHNKIILSVGKPRPHAASVECLAACSIFLEPACKQILERGWPGFESMDSELDALSPSLSLCSSKQRVTADSSSKPRLPSHPFNAIAIRRIPNKWDIYDFLELVIRCLEVDAEVSVVTLVYLERFCGMSGVSFTPDNWQRLTITAMMLASKFGCRVGKMDGLILEGKDDGKSNKVHIRMQQRNGRKSWTTVAGFPEQVRLPKSGKILQVDFEKILRALKKTFKTNGVLIKDPDHGSVMQLQGDIRKEVAATATDLERTMRTQMSICFENPSSSNGPQRLPRRMPKARRGKQALTT